MSNIAITNNCLVCETMYALNLFGDIIFNDCPVVDILESAKKKIKNGAILLVEPFMGSIEPIEQPFKTLILHDLTGPVDFNSLKKIDYAVSRMQKAIMTRPASFWSKSDLLEFRKIDMVLVERWLTKVYYANHENELQY